MAEEADLDDRNHFHSLRHTTDSWLSMSGVTLRYIQAILRHSTTAVTEMYSHLAPETLDRAMEETFRIELRRYYSDYFVLLPDLLVRCWCS